MCGIAGILGPGASVADAAQMVRVQHHRGPDENGLYVDPGGPLVLGHNRLRILDLTPAGRQPMSTPDGRVWIVFNGEVYNYRELKAELADYPYRSTSDTEVILAAYRRWGPACVDRFVGMFAFALWDTDERRLFCARDRLGVKPFLYAWHDGRLYFASEAKALLAAGVPADADDDVWATYLAHGVFDHDERTCFHHIRNLPPGHTLEVRDGQPTIACYWDLASLTQEIEPQTEARAIERFTDLLHEAVRIRLRSDVPVGLNLSGGIDSAALLALIEDVAPAGSRFATFTFAYDDPRYDEVVYADAARRQVEWRRHVCTLSPETAWALLADAVWHQEAPFGGISTLSYHELHRAAAREGVTVLIEGQGVDESIAGYRYHRLPYLRDLLRAGREADLQRELQAEGPEARKTLDELRRLESGGAAAEVYQDGTSHLARECVSPDVLLRAGAPLRLPTPYQDHLRNALYRDLRHVKLPRVLRMNDRLSMASSRELREIYLDHRVMEFLFRLPAELRIHGSQSKHLLRATMAGRLPDAVRLEPKRAVVTPQREWFRGPLRAAILEIVESPRFQQRGWFRGPAVLERFERFVSGEGDNSFFVWQWINTELWHRTFQDPATRRAFPAAHEGPPIPLHEQRAAHAA